MREIFRNIYITGDIHGRIHPLKENVKLKRIGNEDLLIILGDVGANFYNDSDKAGSKDNILKAALNELGCTILCIHGNHEARPDSGYLKCKEEYERVPWCSGEVFVQEKYNNVLFAVDGSVYSLGGKKYLAAGGAYSIDKWYRLRTFPWTWYPDEQLTEEEQKEILRIAEETPDIDYVLAHTCPRRYEPVENYIPGIDQSTIDKGMENFLNRLEDRLPNALFFAGHWHINKVTPKVYFLFYDIVSIQDAEQAVIEAMRRLTEHTAGM